MQIIQLTEETKNNIMENLLKRSPVDPVSTISTITSDRPTMGANSTEPFNNGVRITIMNTRTP